MLELYLVRHGETEMNVKGVYYGWTDCELTEKGIEQNVCLAQVLKNISFDAVLSSDLKRAVATAEIVSGKKAADIILDSRLRERNFGKWEGLHFTELERDCKEQWQKWSNDWRNIQIPEGESYDELYERVKECMIELMDRYKSGKVLIVSHHGCLRLIATILLKLEHEAFWSFMFEHGAYSMLQITGEHCVIRKINCRD